MPRRRQCCSGTAPAIRANLKSAGVGSRLPLSEHLVQKIRHLLITAGGRRPGHFERDKALLAQALAEFAHTNIDEYRGVLQQRCKFFGHVQQPFLSRSQLQRQLAAE